VAGPGDIGQDPGLPGPQYVESGDIIETRFPQPYQFNVHCGIEWLGEFNSYSWRTDDPMPPEWLGKEGELFDAGESIDVTITLFEGDPPRIEAETNGALVTYEPSEEENSACD
jgi:hypothetical protein